MPTLIEDARSIAESVSSSSACPAPCSRSACAPPDWAEPRPAHPARFDLDESALPVGVACLASIALEFLAS